MNCLLQSDILSRVASAFLMTSLPDGWGSLVLDRYLRSKGIDPYRLSLLQRLALVGSTGRGALEFRPDWSEGVPDESSILTFWLKKRKRY